MVTTARELGIGSKNEAFFSLLFFVTLQFYTIVCVYVYVCVYVCMCVCIYYVYIYIYICIKLPEIKWKLQLGSRKQQSTSLSHCIMLPLMLSKGNRAVFFLPYLPTCSFHHHHPHVHIYTQLSENFPMTACSENLPGAECAENQQSDREIDNVILVCR